MFGRIKVRIKEIVNEVWELARVGEGGNRQRGREAEVRGFEGGVGFFSNSPRN